MKFVPASLVLFSFIILSASPVTGGELSDELIQVLSQKRADETIPVIIKLRPTEDMEKLRTDLNTEAGTLAERHLRGINALKDNHRRAQEKLLTKLNELSLDKKANAIKSYWLVNALSAEITAAEIIELAERADIETIYTVPETFLIAPYDGPVEYFNPGEADSVTGNLTYVKADLAHAAGYTGQGRLVCSFDTGIQGDHPALKDSWNGLNGDSAASWFFELDDLNYPHIIPYSTNANHGTHVMGILTGRDPAINYTVGVAPGAKWISAAVIDIAATSILNAFEWAADPDGNPNTIDDVPDVINHSWGIDKVTLPRYSIGCANVFYDAIDNIEMLGIVNIFACGNTGSDTSIYNPANRANDSLDCFAVGNINATLSPPVLATNSSRGPSDCPGGGIKPNVVAPGTSIISSYPTSRYFSYGGTSMAAPHVAGLVALLRQKNPNATVDEIKKAILAGTQADASWGSLPNNRFGWGAIDCMASLNYLSAVNTAPNVRVYDFTHNPISPGDTVIGTVVLQNIGANATNVTAALSGTDPSLTVLTGSASFGNIDEGDTVRSDDTIRVVVADTITEGSVLSLDFNIIGDGYTKDAKLFFIVEPPGKKALATHNTGKIDFTLSNYGLLGLGDGSLYPFGGEGFNYNNGGNDLWESGLILGRSSAEVSSGVHSYIFEPNMDFVVAPGGDMQFFTPGDKAPQQSYSVFRDDNGADPLGVEIRQESFSFEAPYDDFIMIRYILKNINTYNLTNVHLGMFLDWDIPTYNRNAGGYEIADEFSWLAYNAGSSVPILSKFRGMKLIEGPLAGVQTGRSDSTIYIYYRNVFIPTNFDGYTKTEKYTSLTSGFSTADTYKSGLADMFQVMSAGPMSFLPGQERAVTFIIMAGDSLAALRDISVKAVDTFINIPWAPLAPFCISPSDTLLGPEADLTPTFTWTPSADANPDDTVRFILQYDITPAFDNPVSIDSIESASYTLVDPLEYDTEYFWRVLAYDQHGDTTESSNYRFLYLIEEVVPFLIVEPDSIIHTVNDPTDNQEPLSFLVSDYYGGAIPYTAEASPGNIWLSLSNETGTTPAEVELNIDVSGIDFGLYLDSITVSSDTASNSPVFVYVLLTYEPEVKKYVLLQNSPNPFSGSTKISFELERDLPYTVIVYDILGREVDKLSGIVSSVPMEINWSAPSSLTSGIYFYKLSAPNFTSSKKMVLIK
ncbi:MAG: S8 family peptidase [candidate division Zixibacteria bacterium]|nr:S8 family peptidase [candidate division Zixibacteria bacterium]